MKFLFKNFLYLVKRFKTASILNILGLSVAFAVFIVVVIQVHYDLTFDRIYKNSDKIFMFSRYYHFSDRRSPLITQQIGRNIKDNMPEVEDYALLGWNNYINYDVPDNYGNISQHQVSSITATPGFVRIFSLEITAGDTTGLFRDVEKILVSQETVKKMFGDSDPIGKTITRHGSTRPLVIAAVYKDFPKNSSLQNSVYTFMYEDHPSNSSYFGYYLIDPDNIKKVNEKFDEELSDQNAADPENKITCSMEPLKDNYLHTTGKGGSKRINTTWSLMAMGVLTLSVAFINFINLSMAMAPSRVRAINIHKILGINKTLLRFSIAMEGVFISIIALLLSLLCIYFFSTTTVVEIVDASLKVSDNLPIIIFTALAGMVMMFIIGIYMARYAASFDEAIALKGSFAFSGRGNKLRNLLIVVQFTAAIGFISIASFVKIQHDYMQDYSWGIQKENVIYLDVHKLNTGDWDMLGQELKRNPNILDYTLSRAVPGQVHMGWGRQFRGRQLDQFTCWAVHPNFLRFFGANVIAGNDFPPERKEKESIIFNQAFLRAHDLDESIIGEDFECFNPGEILGIVEDINFESLHEPIKPMAFAVIHNAGYSYYFIKITGQDIPGTIAHVKNIWEKFSDQEFGFKFLDEEMDNLYRRENNLAKLIGFFGIITVIIAIMGVYGLVVFNTRYKAKEIAIRKVNGAGIGEVVLMLNRAMLVQFAIAFVIASLLAYLVIHKWLEGFAYKAAIPWWLYPVAGVIVAVISIISVSWQSYKAASANPVDSLLSE